MTNPKLACLVLAAGKGTRMKSKLPKVLHPVAGRPMVRHVLDAVAPLDPDRIAVVVGPGMEAVAAAVAPHPTVVQERQLGTGDAVRAARPILDGFDGDVLVVYGDTPLVTTETLAALVAARRAAADPALVVLGMRPDDPAEYGRLVLDGTGGLERIVEFSEADPTERAISLCNGGLMAFDGRRLFGLVDALANDNSKGEYYLTDAVEAARARGHACAVVEGHPEEVLGVNSRAELAQAEAVLQGRLRHRAMAGGATLVDPATVWLSADTRLGRDVTVGPSTVFGPGVTVEDGVEIKGFCHIEGTVIRSGAVVGPFARLRPGAEVGQGAHVGNFVELKNATLGAGAKANHLTYLGDAQVGPRANIGAGTITCNYDGFFKHRTVIGEEAFIGSNTALVAPVTVGDRANVGAGSVISRDVAPDALALERAEQVEKPGRAQSYRARKAAEKASTSKIKA
ncbi:MAG TPA: bifunctional UDP-N-acetylglucosamine diphosphorylase/glucosamine-1-phosphate N-acetyltransferase GlmU [Alphaproteobacteria bacterium]|nr:bifunctional UDP-N-acetylglucosamine diphosphorylase/glucosamine-1-phosphate N-acetyltransferase GlmU [Alphaproteobacteria bacterium]